LLWLLLTGELSASEMAEALEHDSGLRGLAGSGDMRELLDRAERGDREAAAALEVYLHRLVAGIRAMAAALQGLDALVFTWRGRARGADSSRRRTAGLPRRGDR
jgi:acetate kinase